MATSRDDAYESAAGIRRTQRRRHRLPDAVVVSGLGDGRWLPDDITPATPTGIDTVTDVDIAAEICRQILSDIADGALPADVACFADLHSYCDANMYADEHITAREELSDDEFIDFIPGVQQVVTGWLQAGRSPTFAVTEPIGPVIVQLHTPATFSDVTTLELPAAFTALPLPPSRPHALTTSADPPERH
ncbi:hypothetical protein OG225_41905 (plasmid) [Nocardia sp. NBC_01377]|uniref:hypothetical protein n=1 Tax=Nocardia sp. NBC_01377 TaxID=2903595 RepID=UPI003256833A